MRVACSHDRWIPEPSEADLDLDLELGKSDLGQNEIGVNQATKSMRWMPRLLEAMKDVGGCDKPRGVANQALIRGCPNGKTQQG